MLQIVMSCLRSTESDTETEIVKRDRAASPAQSDITSSQLYRQAQKGGDIPVTGFGFKHPTRTGVCPLPIILIFSLSWGFHLYFSSLVSVMFSVLY
jgi:hypothetical protein